MPVRVTNWRFWNSRMRIAPLQTQFGTSRMVFVQQQNAFGTFRKVFVQQQNVFGTSRKVYVQQQNGFGTFRKLFVQQQNLFGKYRSPRREIAGRGWSCGMFAQASGTQNNLELILFQPAVPHSPWEGPDALIEPTRYQLLVLSLKNMYNSTLIREQMRHAARNIHLKEINISPWLSSFYWMKDFFFLLSLKLFDLVPC